MKKNRITIKKSSGLYVHAFGSGDHERLARLFREVWERVPLKDRRKMTAFWKPQRLKVEGRARPLLCPIIEITTYANPKSEKPGMRREDVYATYYWGEYTLKFVDSWIAAMDDDALRFLIAHELAHMFQHCIGEDPRDEAIEELADEIARGWTLEHEEDSLRRFQLGCVR